jgi:hypothetical protein
MWMQLSNVWTPLIRQYGELHGLVVGRRKGMSKLTEFFQATHTQLGLVFYPTHFMFAAFPSLALARDARARLIECGFAEKGVHVASDTEVLEFFKEFRGEKSAWSRFVRGLGLIEELRFCELDIERACAGACFVAVHCCTEKEARRIKREADQFSIIGMQWYRSFTIHYWEKTKQKANPKP